MIEESDDDIIQLYKDRDFAEKAKMLPVTFVIKARKLYELKSYFHMVDKCNLKCDRLQFVFIYDSSEECKYKRYFK
ncbi:hypothetical protein NNC19_22005 [Clostridium sp. SHJSY1]|uniref:hypothetical protein n=1 Tax=Clostridium sp. SHJSY1 TaxID=2942483 RepID=UPI0028744FDF|nr:hypothetical protein [Clostridium sp. SHJSY1]MDS0528366.1 hypothetical protein [Clostridium sp. SHJSY1]